jgi:hypothetical protein
MATSVENMSAVARADAAPAEKPTAVDTLRNPAFRNGNGLATTTSIRTQPQRLVRSVAALTQGWVFVSRHWP